jgi:hypothetical protein
MIHIAVDPGVSGAVAVLSSSMDVFDVPTFKTKLGKTEYDIPKMVNLLRVYSDVVCMIEAVHAMPGNGGVSMFSFGRGKGIWEGITHALGFKVIMVSPQSWKKAYPELLTPKQPKTSESLKDLRGKSVKERKELTKAAAKAKRLVKAASKAKARELAAQMYPELSDRFTTVNSDGRAEAVLMAHYMKNFFKEI